MKLGNWFGQATTGAGVATMMAAIGGLASGAMGWAQAVPVIVGGLVGVFWPENRNLNVAAQRTVSDITTLVSAYQVGNQGAGAPK